MRRKIGKWIEVMILFLLVENFITVSPCLAASAEITISTDSAKAQVGDSLTVDVTVQSKTEFGGVEANLTYDSEILKYVKGSSGVAGGNGFLKITDTGFSNGMKSKKYTLTFKALKTGSCEIKRDGTAMVYDYAKETGMSVSGNSLKVEVTPAKTASGNASLKTLRISPSKLSPAFDKHVYEYSVTVDANTKQLIIDAAPEDNKSKVSISGNDSLKEGKNKVVVSVLAESGTVIQYNIDVTKEANAKDAKGEKPVASDDNHGVFKLVRMNGEIRAIYSKQYTLMDPDSSVQIPEGYVKQEAIISDIKINAYFKKNNMESDFFLIYAKNEKGEEGFYQYDKSEKTLQRYASQVDSTDRQGKTDSTQQGGKLFGSQGTVWFLAAEGVILVILIVVIIVISLKLRRRRR
jgi:hypothetical protein